MSQTLAADETKLTPPVRTRKGTNEGFLSDTVVRSRVVLEILNTERGYVRNLEDVVEVREALHCFRVKYRFFYTFKSGPLKKLTS